METHTKFGSRAETDDQTHLPQDDRGRFITHMMKFSGGSGQLPSTPKNRKRGTRDWLWVLLSLEVGQSEGSCTGVGACMV